ncbi:MAG: exo-alpha-sialidase, partial [bacterium]|nr:exo-alpha-sialidase [bacterium]
VNRGNVYLLCSVDVPGADPRDVMFSRSTDGGFTWSPPVRVNDVADGWQWFGTMSVAPNGRIDVVWNDTRNDPGGVLSELYYSYSLDAGQTWAPSEPASPVFDPLLGWPQQNKIGDYYHMVSDNLGAGLAYAATFNGEQDVYYLRIGTFDCNGNGVPDDEDITGATSDDCNSNAIPDECEPDEDCNTNGIQDICDIAGSTSYDCTLNGTPDECEPDCNDNAVADSCDIAGDTSDDCNQNRIPDDCDILDLDCNDNGTPDACDVETQDCNANNIPDDCDADYWDCNANNIPDDCDIALGTSDDCTQNGVPDECEPDCDGDDLADSCAIATGLGLDCNGNGAPDACDIDLGLSVDADTNGIPDECDAEACVALWDGFQPNPPFSRTKPLSLIDYNDDGIFWDNPEDTATIDRRGCETGASSDQTVRVDVDSGLADPTDGYVASETFITVDGGLDCGAAIYSLSFKPKVGLSIDSRWDWQLFVFDGKDDVPVIQLEFISLSSQRQEVVPGRILVRNPAPPPAARYLDTGIDITLDGCYDLEIVLDNVDHTVQLLVDGSPALAQTIAPLNSSALRMDHFQVVAVENLGQTTTLTNLKLDDFELCRNGLSTMTWLDCNDNCVDDAWDITNEVSRDCNHNEVPDECDLAGSTSTDTNNNRVPDECDGSQRGDFDNDGDIDRADYAAFRQCITGPGGGPVAGSCRAGDFDFDDDVDLGDFSWFQDDFDNGAGRGVLKGARTVSGSLSKR